MPSSGDTVFRLECVLLFALDVVKGPYIHSCAPANPHELIRSFLQAPASPSSTTVPCANVVAAASHGLASTTTASSDAALDAAAENNFPRTGSNAGRRATPSVGFAPSSLPHGTFPSYGSTPVLDTSPLLGSHNAAPSLPLSQQPQYFATATPPPPHAGASGFAGPSSPTTSTRASSTAGVVHSTAIGASLHGSAPSSSLLAQRRLLGLGDALNTPDDGAPYTMGGSAPSNNPSTSNPHNNASVSEDANTLFAISPKTNLSESQQTLPSLSPMAGSFACGANNASISSATGSAAAAAAAAVLHAGSPALALAQSVNTDDDHQGSSPHLPPPGRSGSLHGGGTHAALAAAGSSAHTSVFRSDSSSPLATPLQTPPLMPEAVATASRRASESGHAELPAGSGGAAYGQPQTSAHHHHHNHHGTGGGRGGLPSTAGVGAVPAPAAEDGRISSYNDVFVPRSEFCRRVLWLYPAESGLLFLYYAEDIPGEHYQRKTLRYSICLVFCVDEKRMTIGAGLLHQLVRPYSVVLTNIAEELREAELKYAYMSRGLQTSFTLRRPPAPRAPDGVGSTPVSLLTAPASISTAATNRAKPAAEGAVPKNVEPDENGEEGEMEEEAVGGTPTSTTPGGAPKSYRFGRRRVVSESSARPDTYHLALVERGMPPATATVTLPSGDTKTTLPGVTAAADTTPTSFMSPLPPHTSAGEGAGGEDTAAAAAMADVASKRVTADVHRQPSDAAEADKAATTTTTTTATNSSGANIHSASPSYPTTGRTTGTTPSSQFGTPFSPPAAEATATAAGTSSTSAVSPSLTTTPPSSLPMRSRTVSNSGGAFFQLSSTQSPALGDSVSTATTAPSPLSAMASSSAGAGATAAACGGGGGGVAGPFPSVASVHHARQPPLPSLSGTTCTLYGSANPSSYRCGSGATGTSSGTATNPTSTTTGGGHASSGGGGGGAFACAHSPHNINTLNAFITPTTAPNWTPLSELVEELYRCLRYSGDDDAAADGDADVSTATSCTAATTTLATTSATNMGNSLHISPASKAALCGNAASSAFLSRPAALPRAPLSTSPARAHRTGNRQLYSPLTAMLPGGGGGGSREPSWTLEGSEDGGEVAQAGRAARPFTTHASKALLPRSPLSLQQPMQRGDVSVVHLSDRLSFHVRRMAPLQAARLLHFDHVPVPIVPYDSTMMEWMDMAVHHVFRLVDGVRTVADLVFDVAMGTTTTLAEVYAAALRRSTAQRGGEAAAGPSLSQGGEGNAAGATNKEAALHRGGVSQNGVVGSAREKTLKTSSARRPGLAQSSGGSSTTAAHDGTAGKTRDATPTSKALQGGGGGGSSSASVSPTGAAAPSSRVQVVSVPIDPRPSLTLLPGVRYSMPTSAAAAAAAAAISDGQAAPPSFVNVRVSPPPQGNALGGAPQFMGGGGTGAMPRSAVTPSAAATTTAASQPRISVELPLTWVATTGIVVEALLHLELCHLIKIYRPWTEDTLYSTTPQLQRVLRNVRHSARHTLAYHLLHVAWVEQQEMRRARQMQRRTAAVERKAHIEQQAQQKVRNDAVESPNCSHAPPGLSVATQGPSTSVAAASAPTPAAATPSKAAATPFSSGLPKAAKKAATTLESSADRAAMATAAAVTIPKPSSSLPKSNYYSDPLAPQTHLTHLYNTSPSLLSSGASSLPRPPHSGSVTGASANNGCLDVASNAVTRASSVSTSYAMSCSLKHTVSVGAAGKLHMNLIGSLPTSPLLHPGVATRAVGSLHAQRSLLEGLPPPAADPPHLLPRSSDTDDDASTTSSSSSRSSSRNSAKGKADALNPARAVLRASARVSLAPSGSSSFSATSSRSSSVAGRPRGNSQHASSPVSLRKRRSGLCGTAAGASSPSTSSSASASSTPSASAGGATRADPLPHSLPALLVTSASLTAETEKDRLAGQHGAARTHSPEKELLSSPSAAGVAAVAAAEAHFADTSAITHWSSSLDLETSAAGKDGIQSAKEAAPVVPANVSARVKNAAPESQQQQTVSGSGCAAAPAGARRKTGRSPKRMPALRVFVPTDAELNQAAAAALCALAKFGSTSVASVQAEMRRMPVWSTAFNGWSLRCVNAMVEVAVLNDWLEDVSQ